MIKEVKIYEIVIFSNWAEVFYTNERIAEVWAFELVKSEIQLIWRRS